MYIPLSQEKLLRYANYVVNEYTRDSHLEGLLLYNGTSPLKGARFFKLALKYVPEIRSTYGILLLDTASLPDLSSWGQSLHASAEACSLPFLLPIYMIEESLKQGTRGISNQDTRVNRIQEATGQFVPSENFPLPGIDIWKLDYTDLTRQLNFSADVTSSESFLFKGLSVALRVLANWNTSLASPHSEGEERDELLQDQDVVREKLEYIRGGIDAALMHAEHVQRRTEAFRQLVRIPTHPSSPL